MKKILTLGTTCLVLFSLNARADKIQGRVTTTGNQPLQYVNVALLRTSDSTFVDGVVTDSIGSFQFDVPAQKSFLLRLSSVGYATVWKTCTPQTGSVTVVMNEAERHLQTAVVKASRPVFRSEQGAVVADVASSVLKYETSLTDVLRKMPGMTLRDDQLKTFSGSTPVIYLNGRKVQDYKQIENMPVESIRTVKLLTHPGPEYDADAKAVLLITTRKTEDAFSALLSSRWTLRHHWDNAQQADVVASVGRLSFFGSLQYDDKNQHASERYDLHNWINNVLYRDGLNMGGKCTGNEWDYKAGFTYDLADGHQVGIQYDGYSETECKYLNMNSYAETQETGTDSIRSKNLSFEKDRNNHYNAYYNGTFGKKWKVSINGDYINRYERTAQHVDEVSDKTGEQTVRTLGRTHYDIWATKGVLSYQANEKTSYSAGGEWGLTRSNSSMTYNKEGSNSDYGNRERRVAVFAEGNWELWKSWTLNAGLRYEKVELRQTDRMDASLSFRRNYSNLFPSVSLSYEPERGGSHTLSFSSSIDYPSYSSMTASLNYVNHYVRTNGNVQLLPSRNYEAAYSFAWKFLMAEVQYTYSHNFIGQYLRQNSADPNIAELNYKNYAAQHEANVMVSARQKWGFYEPRLTLMATENWYRMIDEKGHRINSIPTVGVNLDNSLHLPWALLAGVEYDFCSKVVQAGISRSAMHTVNLSLNRDFFNKRLSVTLQTKNLLNEHPVTKFRYGPLQIEQKSKYNYCRSLTINLKYRLNQSKKSYQGENAAENELKRL